MSFDNLAVEPAGSLRVLRFAGTSAVPGSDKVRTTGTFYPESEDDTLVLMSDGQRWYEIARSYHNTTYVKPPLVLDGTGLGPMTYLYIKDHEGEDLASFGYSTSPSVYRDINMWVGGGQGSFSILETGGSVPVFSVNPATSPAGVIAALDMYAAANMIVAQQQRHVAETYTFTSTPVNPLPAPAKHIIRLDPDGASRTVQGIAADTPGLTYGDTVVYEFINVAAFASGFDVNFENETSTNAADRVITGTNGTVALGPQQTFRIWYDQDSARWRILS